MADVVEIFSDGACRGNPGPGGWGVLMRFGQHEKHFSGASAHTTNNRMELTAVIEALLQLKRPCVVHITTDSKYVKDGMTQWLPNWLKKNWKNSTNKPVKNQDLWQALVAAIAPHDVTWHWVKGHSGHRENEIADELANQAIDELRIQGKS